MIRFARREVVVTVWGSSMEPIYNDGDRILVRRDLPPVIGRLVVIEEPALDQPVPPMPTAVPALAIASKSWVVKRVAAVAGDPVPSSEIPALAYGTGDLVPEGMLLLTDDNPKANASSMQLGYFACARVLGSAIRKMIT